MSADTQIAILDGDNKFELFAQLSDWGRTEFKHRRPFRLIVQHPKLRGALSRCRIGVIIHGISVEDGSGDNWIINGNITTIQEDISYKQHLEHHGWLRDFESFTGFYSTLRRKGYLRPGRN